MGIFEGVESPVVQSEEVTETNELGSPRASCSIPAVVGQTGGESGLNGLSGGGANSYIYAIGQIMPRFPSLGVEKEFAQAAARSQATAGLTDREAFYAVLSKPENRYLSRQLCWVLTIEGLDTYILKPGCFGDFNLLVESVRPGPRKTDMDVVIGLKGSLAPPEMCNGLMVPIVVFDQIYSFDIDSLIAAMPQPKEIESERFEATAERIFERITQMADNAGSADEHRALNYLAVRYPAIYHTAAEEHKKDCSLSAIEVRSSRLSGMRKVMDVIFAFTNRKTDVTEKYFVRVDVTEEFPFLVTKMSSYYDR